MRDSVSLYELNAHIKQVMALNFQEPIWLRAELARVNSSRGHVYLELVDKEASGEIRAQSQGVIWHSTFRQLQKRLGDALGGILQVGMEVLVQVRVGFHERYGLKLTIADLDPDFTMGQLELERRRTLETLAVEQLLDRNSTLPMPRVLQRLAVISSPRAAGFADFMAQLESNPFGYQFDLELFPAAVQGENAEPELLRQLKVAGARPKPFDAVVIIRGGGSRLDLAVFDRLELCRGIALSPMPVITGIGHEIDQSVADRVAHTSLKTPTAVAEFLINRNAAFEQILLDTAGKLATSGRRLLVEGQLGLASLEEKLVMGSEGRIAYHRQLLSYIDQELPRAVGMVLQEYGHRLDKLEAAVRYLDPVTALDRGFSITRKGGTVVRSSDEVAKGDLVETTFRKGSAKSRVE